MSEELRECPFCGGNAKIETAFYDCDHFWVQCENCKSGTWSHEDSPDEAIAAWNKRTAPDAPAQPPQGEWQPVPDGMYEYPNWNGKGTVIIRILNDGAELEQWHNSLPDDIEEISLSSDYRLCQRKQNVQETESC